MTDSDAPVRGERNSLNDELDSFYDGDGKVSPNAVSGQRYVHPEAASLFQRLPCTTQIPLFSESCEGYGPRCVLSLGCCYFFNKGLGNYLMSYCRYAMFVDRFGVDATRTQRLQSIAKMGWSIKAFTAAFSDCVAIGGYTKRWYCAGSCVIGAALTLGFGLLPAKTSSADIAAGFLFLANFCMANVDILSEGHYSRLMRKRPASGPALVSWIWWFILSASLISAGIQGPLSDNGIPQVGLYISAASQLLAVFFFIFNWYGERLNSVERLEDARALHMALIAERNLPITEPVSEKNLNPERLSNSGPEDHSKHLQEELTQGTALELYAEEAHDWDDFVEPDTMNLCYGFLSFNRQVFMQNWRILIYSFVMVCSVVAAMCVTVLGSSWDLFYCSLVVAIVNCGLAFWATPFLVAKTIVFIYFNMLLYLQVNSLVDSFFLAKEECFPEGPHFTYVFYNTVGAIIGNVGGLIGVTAFSYIFSKQTYSVTFIVTTTIQVLASIFDIVIVKRWNLYIGIPDHAMYILGDTIVYEVCYMLSWMPVVVLISRICPRGSESMIYALVAGLANFGQSMSSTIGSLLQEFKWTVVTKGAGKCNFDNLPMLLVVGHLLLPLLIVPLSMLLLPRARICDDIDENGNVVKKTAPPTSAEGSETLSEPFDENHHNSEKQ